MLLQSSCQIVRYADITFQCCLVFQNIYYKHCVLPASPKTASRGGPLDDPAMAIRKRKTYNLSEVVENLFGQT